MESCISDCIFKYYGVDWLAVIFTMIQLYLLGRKNIYGFVYGIIASFFWMAFAFQVGSIANIIANCFFFFINVKGMNTWKAEEKQLNPSK